MKVNKYSHSMQRQQERYYQLEQNAKLYKMNKKLKKALKKKV